MAWKCSEPVRLVWKSDAVISALNIVSVGERFMFSNALRGKGSIFYTSQASGFVVSQTYGPESKDLPPAWEMR
jgi:hypothetical protein